MKEMKEIKEKMKEMKEMKEKGERNERERRNELYRSTILNILNDIKYCNHDDEQRRRRLINDLQRYINAEEKIEGKGDRIKINPNTVISGCISILSVLIITQHEKLDVITSKALSFVIKPKV